MAAHREKDSDHLKAVLLEVFGTTDDEDDSSGQERINGLHHCQNHVDHALHFDGSTCLACLWSHLAGKQVLTHFLCLGSQDTTLKGVEAEGWFENAGMNQAMCFGSLPDWAKDLTDALPTALFSTKVAINIHPSWTLYLSEWAPCCI